MSASSSCATFARIVASPPVPVHAFAFVKREKAALAEDVGAVLVCDREAVDVRCVVGVIWIARIREDDDEAVASGKLGGRRRPFHFVVIAIEALNVIFRLSRLFDRTKTAFF